MSERYSVFAWKKTWTSLEEDTAETPGAAASCMFHGTHPSFFLHHLSTNFPSWMKYIRSVMMSPYVSSTAARCAPFGIDPWSMVAVRGKFVSRYHISILKDRAGKPTILPTLNPGSCRFVIIRH